MKHLGKFFGWQPQKVESKETLPSTTTVISIDKFSLDILQKILDQLDLASIFHLKRGNKELSKKITVINAKVTYPQTYAYLILRQQPECRSGSICFGELYDRNDKFEVLELSIYKSLSDVESSQVLQMPSAEQLAFILFNMQLYFENNPVTEEQWGIFKIELPKLITNIFAPLQEKLTEKKLFWFILRVIHEQLRILPTKKKSFLEFIESLKEFLEFFKEHSFSIDKLSPKRFNALIDQSADDNNIYEELCLVLSGINDFLNLEIFNYFVSFLTKNKNIANRIWLSDKDGFQVYEYLLPLFLRYHDPEKKVITTKEIAKVCNQLIRPDDTNIRNTIVLSKNLARLSKAQAFTGRSSQQNFHLLQLLWETLQQSKEADEKKRGRWFTAAIDSLLIFISTNTRIKSEYIKFIFIVGKINSDTHSLAKAMQLALENEEKFVTIEDIQTWFKMLPAKLPANYTKFSGLNYLIYLLTKALHALGLVDALKDKDKVKGQLIDTIIIKANSYVTLYGDMFQFLEFLGKFYDEKITSKEAGVFLLDTIRNVEHVNLEFLTSDVVSLLCKFIKENLISSDISYKQFIDVLLTAGDIDTPKCLQAILVDRIVITNKFLNELEKIFKYHQKNALLAIKLLHCYRFFKPDEDLENILQSLGRSITQKNDVLVKALQLLKEFCEATQGILNNKNKEMLFLVVIEKIRYDNNFVNIERFNSFLRFLLKFKEIYFNNLIKLFAEFNLSVKVSADELFYFDFCCIKLYANCIIKVKHLCWLLVLANKDFALANTFVLSLMDKGEARIEILQQLANKCDEMRLVVPEAIWKDVKKLEPPEGLDNFNEEQENDSLVKSP